MLNSSNRSENINYLQKAKITTIERNQRGEKEFRIYERISIGDKATKKSNTM